MSAGDDDLIGRWSRRKQAARRQEAEEAAKADEMAAMGEEAARDVAEPEPAGPAEPADPPPSLDDLTAEGDLSAFLRDGVPAALRNSAMRKMWSLDPAIRDYVGLSENSWDFNKPGAMPGFGPLEAGRAVVDFLSSTEPDMPADAAPADAEPPAAAPEETEVPQPEPEIAPAPPAPDDLRAEAAPARASRGEDLPAHPPRPRHGDATPR